MSVTVGVNFQSVVHQASNGITIAFPDVCKTPLPVGPVPLPYPNIATTANAIQKKKTTGLAGSGAITVGSKYSPAAGNVAGASQKIAVQAEIQQLKGLLGQINSKLLVMSTNDPNQWQLVLQEYALAASALYVTIHG